MILTVPVDSQTPKCVWSCKYQVRIMNMARTASCMWLVSIAQHCHHLACLVTPPQPSPLFLEWYPPPRHNLFRYDCVIFVCPPLLYVVVVVQSALREAAKQEDKQGVVAIAKKAHDLYKQQQEIQKRADQRYIHRSPGHLWCG